ncbi:HD domain-containing protein [Roseibium denhamense]|uniref:HDIG domain-containing protein n=1 Tax=Roseibium denhamense TaxID=76305 RepID=A0ABY1NWA0_9HYPH|nr:HD domain-containing phosphohydrolase [Roseibium denhamense]MTI05425.1 HD domain-containing protein [Roseibium denhamense]SMP18711.1 HDIG domain-containing protein [Roseibium denhamense]
MHDVLFVSDSIPRSIDRASLIARAFNTLILAPKRVNASQMKSAGIVVFDLLLNNQDTVELIEEAQRQNPNVIVFYSGANQVEKVQANTLTGAQLAERSHRTAPIVRMMQTLLRGKKKTTTMREAAEIVDKIATSFEDISMAAILGDPIPLQKLTDASDTINGTLAKYSLSSFLGALQDYHSHTTRHTLLVATVAADFCEKLKLSEKTREMMVSGAIVHDIGKTSIPLAILDKPGKLSESEMELVRTHARHGQRILAKHPKIDDRIKTLALEHHEFLDGSGYPDGKSGNDLCTEVRILTICDIYSALIEQRSYKAPIPSRIAIGMLEEMGGKLDQRLVAEFKKIHQAESGFAKVRPRRAS